MVRQSAGVVTGTDRAFRLMLLLGCVFFLGFVSGEAKADRRIYHISDNGGGDCGDVGAWDESSRTCTLTRDTDGLFIIESDDVTLDGAGHAMIGTNDGSRHDDGSGHAVLVVGRRGVTVKNLMVSRYDYAVNLEFSSGCIVSGIRAFENAYAGVSLTESSGNAVSGNVITNGGFDTGICIGFNSNDNEISGNTISGAERAIFIHTLCDANRVSDNDLLGNSWAVTLFDQDSANIVDGNRIRQNALGVYLLGNSHDNIFSDNDIIDNGQGVLLEGTANNLFFGNSFVGNQVQAESTGGGSNSFNLPAAPGGNYWDDFDEEVEGCIDNGIGFCETAYGFEGGSDALPRMAPARQLCSRPQLGLAGSEASWSSYGDYRQRRLAVDLLLAHSSGSPASNVTITSFAGSGGAVALPVDGPLALGPVGPGPGVGWRVYFTVPAGVSHFRVSLWAVAADPCGWEWSYPS